jgi:hypothetical protein
MQVVTPTNKPVSWLECDDILMGMASPICLISDCRRRRSKAEERGRRVLLMATMSDDDERRLQIKSSCQHSLRDVGFGAISPSVRCYDVM